MKAPRARAAVGERRAPGEVRPVTSKTVFGILAAVIVVVVIASAVLILASPTPKTTSNTGNVPRALGSAAGPGVVSAATYRESIQPSSKGTSEQVVPAELTLQCNGVCTSGTLQGYLGTFTLTTVFGATVQLTGTLNGSCETITLTPQGELNAAPQILTGTITRPESCTTTTNDASTPIDLRLDRT